MLVVEPIRGDLVLYRTQVADRDRAGKMYLNTGLDECRVAAIGLVFDIAVGHPLSIPRRRHRIAAVPRADHGRVHQFVHTLVRHQQFAVLQRQLHFIARHDIGDIHHEHIGALLVEQGSVLTFLLRCFEDLFRLFLLFNFRPDGARADLHDQALHCRAGRAREHIARIDRPLARVAIALCHRHSRDGSIDDDVGFAEFQRQPVGGRITIWNPQIRCKAAIAIAAIILGKGMRGR